MKTIGEYQFPETRNEMAGWLPSIKTCALDRRVLAVCKTRCEGTWAAYIGAVEGQNHDREQKDVLREGTKLPKAVAVSIFGDFGGLPYCY